MFENNNKPLPGSADSVAAFKAAQEREKEIRAAADALPAPELSLQIGALTLKNPLTAAAGCYGAGDEYAELNRAACFGALFTCGLSLQARVSAPAPRIYESAASILYNNGCVNYGIEAELRQMLPQAGERRVPLIANLCGFSPAEFAELAATAEAMGADGIELNLSCCDGGGLPFDAAAASIEAAVRAAREGCSLPLIAKLTPYSYDIGEEARAAEAGGADALSLINPLPGMAVNAYTGGSMLGSAEGYICGPALKPIALRAVSQAARAVQIPLFGCGGIYNGFDALEFFAAGARAVQIGSANFHNPALVEEILQTLTAFMQMQGYSDMQDYFKAMKRTRRQ